jgi:hypothetical protein
MANALNWVKRPNCEDCDFETFSDPLGVWLTRWFYVNTNAENYYTASGGICDPNYRGNQPDGIWISDDRGCGNLVVQSPVRIDFLNNYGDNATSFSMDHFTCASGVTLNIYDKDGGLAVSEPVPPDCFDWSHFSTPLTNGISAFEYAYTGGHVEGNTSIDNVELCFASALTDTIIATDVNAKEKVPPLKIKDSMSSKNFKVKPIDDLIPEPTKKVTIRIKPDPAYITGSP